MVGLKPVQRRVLVAHLPELANVAAGSLLFGQFLSERPYSVSLALLGVGVWVVLIGYVCALAAGERP
jgi:predicted acyltransferase